MAATAVYIFSILIPLCTVVLSEDAKTFPNIPGLPSFPSFPGLSSIPGFSSLSGGSGLPSFPGLSSLSGGSRDKRQAEAEHDEEHEKQDRLFFTLLPTLTSCTYSTEPGRSCRSCTQTLTCLPNNVGFLRTCHGLFRYCNNGRCSLYQGSACSATTTASTSTSSTSSTTSSTSTSSTSSTTSTTTPTP